MYLDLSNIASPYWLRCQRTHGIVSRGIFSNMGPPGVYPKKFHCLSCVCTTYLQKGFLFYRMRFRTSLRSERGLARRISRHCLACLFGNRSTRSCVQILTMWYCARRRDRMTSHKLSASLCNTILFLLILRAFLPPLIYWFLCHLTHGDCLQGYL